MSALGRTASGDVAIPLRIETDLATLTATKIEDQFNLWLGEWFLDTTQGFPWLTVLANRALTLSQKAALLRSAIRHAPGVQSVNDLSLTADPQTQQLAYSFEATLNTGETLTGGSGVPFVVSGGSSS